MWDLGRQRPAYRSKSWVMTSKSSPNKETRYKDTERERERERERGAEQEAMRLLLEVALFLVCLGSRGVFSEQQRYEVGDPVPFYANVVGPFQNPRYFNLFPIFNTYFFAPNN